jgi:hypothetical protein
MKSIPDTTAIPNNPRNLKEIKDLFQCADQICPDGDSHLYDPADDDVHVFVKRGPKFGDLEISVTRRVGTIHDGESFHGKAVDRQIGNHQFQGDLASDIDKCRALLKDGIRIMQSTKTPFGIRG